MNEAAVNELVKQSKKGSAKALTELLRWVVPLVHGTLFGMARNHDLAQELTQEVAEVVVTRLASFKEGTRFRQWVLTIAANRFRDHLRREKRQALPSTQLMKLHSPHGNPGKGVEKQAIQQELWTAINTLGEEERAIFCLRQVGELSFKEIAKALGKPLGTVLSIQHRAMARLAQKINKSELKNES